MKALTQETTLDGIAQKLPELSNQLVAIFDKAMDLEIKADWYDILDPEWGGSPAQSDFKKTSQDLRKIYMSLASITGLDPCEQFKCTKQRRRPKMSMAPSQKICSR